jgi:hypothetical protein
MNLLSKRDRFASLATRLRQSLRLDRYAVFGLIGTVGVLALVFSALSPNDDEIQQEFAQGSKNRQCVAQNWKSLSNDRNTPVNPVQDVVIGQVLPSSCCSVTGCVEISDLTIGATTFCSRMSGRSPPAIAILQPLNS